MQHTEPKKWAILLTLFVATLVTVIAMPNDTPEWLVSLRPDFLLLTAIFWNIRLPYRLSIGWAWVLGLFMDLIRGALLGQHALAMALVIAISHRFHLQMRAYQLVHQCIAIFLMLIVYEASLMWIDGIAGIPNTSAWRWLPVITGTALWPLVASLLHRFHPAPQ